MSDILFFDAWTQVGPRPHKHHAERWSLAHLIDEMEHCSVSGALVSSTQAINYDPLFSNLALSDALKNHSRLRAVWNVIPHFTDEFPEPGELVSLLRSRDVRAVSIHPKTNGWDSFSSRAELLFRTLAEQGFPVFIGHGEIGDYRSFREFLDRYPELSVVLTGAVWNDQRYVLPLLEDHPNLNITFERFQINRGLEDLVARGLENQLLYASQAPLRSMGAHRAYIDYAMIAPEARQKIASGNLLRLLREEGCVTTFVNENEDSFMQKAREGAAIPHIDMHMHVLHEGMNGGGGSYRMFEGGPAGVFSLLRHMGCQGGGFMSWNGTVSADTVAGNLCTAAALDAAPPGYWGLASFDPLHYSLDDFRRQISSFYAADRRFIGMKPYWIQGLEYTDHRYEEWWRYGNEHSLYALIHRVRNDFREIDVLAFRYPNVRWVVAHCAADFATADQAIECALKHPNVFLEITLTPTVLGVIDYLVEGAGSDRVVYGSDLPMRDPRQQFGWVVFSRLSEEQKQRVLLLNAFDIVGPCLDRLPLSNRPPNLHPSLIS